MNIVVFVVEIAVFDAEVARHKLLVFFDHKLVPSIDEEVIIVDHSFPFCCLHGVVLLIVQGHEDGYSLEWSLVLVLACVKTSN